MSLFCNCVICSIIHHIIHFQHPWREYQAEYRHQALGLVCLPTTQIVHLCPGQRLAEKKAVLSCWTLPISPSAMQPPKNGRRCKVRFRHCVCMGISSTKWDFHLEIEDAKKSAETAALQSPPPAAATPGTPDYAAGLSATPTYAPPTPQPAAGMFLFFFCCYFQHICLVYILQSGILNFVRQNTFDCYWGHKIVVQN